MANYRRKRPKEAVVPRNGEWSHPPVEKGRYKFSTVANKRRANSANYSDEDYIGDTEYDPLDTTQLIPRKNKPHLTQEQRAIKREATQARNREWREWFNKNLSWWRPKKEEPKKELDLGKQPELIQPKRKRK